MRMKHEFGHVEAQRGLLLSKKATQDIIDHSLDKRSNVVSPETLTHRFQQGWQHLQDTPENLLNNNNKILSTKDNLNISNNNNTDDVILASSPAPPGYFIDDTHRSPSRAETEDSGSSSEEEDSSLSFSDTSPLLDVSSLDSSSTSSSSNDSEDTDMSEDENFDDDDDLGSNNGDVSEDKDQSMDTSWMSFSSVASTESPAEKLPVTLDVRRQYPSKRNGIVLPDVLPVGIPKDDDRALSNELELQLRRRDLQLDAAPKLSGECCIVEITTQPDIQVDIRLNAATKRQFSETYIKHRNTYPRDSKNYNLYFNTRDVNNQVVKNTQKNTLPSSRDSVSSRYFTLGEGVRLNNFTIVNGLKAMSLTELVKSDDEEVRIETRNKKLGSSNCMPIESSTQTKSSQTDDEPPLQRPNLFNLLSKDNRRRHNDYMALDQRPCIDVTKGCHTVPQEKQKSEINRSHKEATGSEPVLNPRNTVASSSGGSFCNKSSPRFQQKPMPQMVKGNERREQSSTKPSERKLSSPELYEVYTMETAVPHINWAAVSRANRENEWLKKRQKDREEIRRKLAMDSDNEDYVAEKMTQKHEGAPVDRLKGGSNLQICFVNEAAKDTEIAEAPNDPPEPIQEKTQRALPRMLKRNLLFPPNLPKCIPNSSKVQINNNNNSPPPQVVKRQRPTFFFNRPRSWHAAKTDDEKPDLEEDLFTRHRRLQLEAREALAQAKDMARMQMELERQKKKKSPIADIVGMAFPEGGNLLSRHTMLDMNVAQLQVIVNDLHSQIETLNENLVKFLLERDDLHMEQDSMLVDIEDLTGYLGLKGNMTHSDSRIAANFQANTPNDKLLRAEPVRRSLSVHLKKSKNFV